MTAISLRMAEWLAGNGTIDTKDRELYVYGIEQGLMILLNLITVILIGFVLGMVWQSVVFMILYFPLRSFAGGFHSRTRLGCYITSVFLITGALISIKHLTLSIPVYIAVLFFVDLVLFLFAPVEDMNKPLDQKEIRIYRKRTRAIVLFEGIIFAVLLIADAPQAANCILFSCVTAAALVLLGKTIKAKPEKEA